MNSFFTKLKIVFEKIPIKARFLKDLGFNISYSGFRYFMQGRKPVPSKKLMENLCDNIGYELIVIPIKKADEEASEMKKSLEDTFFADLDAYLKKYENDPARVYSKDFGGESSVAKAIEAFENEEFDPNEKIDVSDLF